MTIQVRCPVCSSEEVYSLLNTLHCKRCGALWNADKKNGNTTGTGRFASPVNNPEWTIKITNNLETRMEKRLDDCLKKYHGRFSMDKVSWKIGDISIAMFRRYLLACVMKRTLAETKDRHGRTWYSRPE
jgi:hypothetical protein